MGVQTALIAAKAVSRDEPTEDLDGLALFYRTNGLPPAQLCRINTNGLAPQARSVDSFKARQSSGMSGGMTDLEQWGELGSTPMRLGIYCRSPFSSGWAPRYSW